MNNKLLINEYPLQVLPSLAKIIGLNEAIFLQQLHYWLQKSNHKKDNYVWIYNSYEAWNKQFPFWSVCTIKRIVKTLEDKKLIISNSFNSAKMDKTKWYTIDYNELENISRSAEILRPSAEILRPSAEISQPSYQVDTTIVSSCDDHEVNLIQAIPETTTETTTEIDTSESPKKQLIPDHSLAYLWNSICTNLPKVIEYSPSRKNKEKVRLKERNIDSWKEVFIKLNISSWCKGKNDRGWKATYDWIISNSENSIKTLEGKYDDTIKKPTDRWWE